MNSEQHDNSNTAPAVQQPVVSQTQVTVLPPKDKTVAVLLAVFLGFWTWLYTYQDDKVYFWIHLGVFGGLVLLALPTFFMTLFLLPVWGFASWLWALIDTAVKTDAHFASYPQRHSH